jgi:hypothetical protein
LSVAGGHVIFDFSFQGYKYQASTQALSKEAFYAYADQLRAHVRFRSDWAAVTRGAFDCPKRAEQFIACHYASAAPAAVGSSHIP